MANKRKNSGKKIRSVRGHDEGKTYRYRQVTVNMPIDKDGNVIERKAQLPPSQPTPLSQAFTGASDQVTPPTVDVKDNPKPEKHKAKVLQFKPKVVLNKGKEPHTKKVTPQHCPHPSTVAANKSNTISQTHGITETRTTQCSLDNNTTATQIAAEKKFLYKLAYTSASGNVYVPETEAKAQKAARLTMLSTHEHDAAKIRQRRFSKAQRAVAIAHIELMKEHPEDTVGMYHGSQGVSKDLTAAKLAEKYGDTLSSAHNVVQTTSTPSNTGCEGVFKEEKKIWGIPNVQQVASAARNDPSWQPDAPTVLWYANNVKPIDWPDDMRDSIHSHLAAQPTVLNGGETYRRSVLINSYEQQIKGLKAEIATQDEELLNLSAEVNLLVWSDAIASDSDPYVRTEYVTQVGKKPTPALNILRNQFKTHMSLHRSDPIKHFLRTHGYNANDSEALRLYNKAKRAKLKAIRVACKALRHVGRSLDNKRIAAATEKIHNIGVLYDRQQAARDVGGSLPKEVSVYRNWGGKPKVIDKQYPPILGRVNNEYVSWWYEAVRLRDEPTHSERLEKLLEKPVNKAAYKTVSVAKKIKKILLTDVNPITRSRKQKAEKAKEVRKQNNKLRRAEAKVDKKLVKTERQLIREAMRIAH